jgi:hypothetical protein
MTCRKDSAMQLAIDRIRMDGGTQPRARLVDATVEQYALAMSEGEQFPPVEVFHDGTDYWLADGFHRVRAAQQAGLAEVDASVSQGTIEDARWYSFGANKAHGLQRTNDDKEKAVRAALRHAKALGLSDRELARHLGVHHVTVGKYRSEMESSGEIHQIERRAVTRGDSTYQQDTANIGGGRRFPPPPMRIPTAPHDPAAEEPQTDAGPSTPPPAKRPGGNAPKPFRPDHGPDSPVPMMSISLPLNNPQMAARGMLERFSAEFLCSLVSELSQLLAGETNDRQQQ